MVVGEETAGRGDGIGGGGGGRRETGISIIARPPEMCTRRRMNIHEQATPPGSRDDRGAAAASSYSRRRRQTGITPWIRTYAYYGGVCTGLWAHSGSQKRVIPRTHACTRRTTVYICIIFYYDTYTRHGVLGVFFFF